MTAPVQKGTTLIVGIGSYTLSGYIVEEVGLKPTAEIETIKGEDNESVTQIISDPGKELTLAVIAKSGAGIESLGIGSVLAVNGVSYLVTDVDPKRSRGALKATIKLMKKDSMTYT